MECKFCGIQGGNANGFKCDFCGATNHSDGSYTQGDRLLDRKMYERNMERQEEIRLGLPRRRSREADNSPRWNRY